MNLMIKVYKYFEYVRNSNEKKEILLPIQPDSRINECPNAHIQQLKI